MNVSFEYYKYICGIKNSKNGYPLHILTKGIDDFRENLPDEEDDSEVFMKSARSSEEDESSEIQISSSMKKLLNKLNNTTDFQEVFCKLTISESGGINVLELFRVLNKAFMKEADQIKKLTESLDQKSSGIISYKKFYSLMKSSVNNYNHSIILHSKFLMWLIKRKFNSDVNLYLKSKKLDSKRIINLTGFSKAFLTDFLNDPDLLETAFNSKKEKTGSNKDKILMKKFIEWTLEHQELVEAEQINAKQINKMNLSKEEIKNKMNKLIKELGSNDISFLDVFNEQMDHKMVNTNGECKINSLKKMINDNYEVDDEMLSAFVTYFGNINENLFNVVKLIIPKIVQMKELTLTKL